MYTHMCATAFGYECVNIVMMSCMSVFVCVNSDMNSFGYECVRILMHMGVRVYVCEYILILMNSGAHSRT